MEWELPIKSKFFRENTFRENIRYITTSLIVYHTWSGDTYRMEIYLPELYTTIMETYGIYRVEVINFAVRLTSTMVKICHDGC